MDFDLTQDQQLLKDSVERLLTERYTFERRQAYLAEERGWSREMWSQYAEMGMLALPFAEADGGLGGGPVATLIVMENFGRALVLEPFLATVLLGGGCLRLGASEEQHKRWLPSLIDGTQLYALAHTERAARYDLAHVDTTARRKGDAWLLNGTKHYVLHGDCADQLVVSARISGKPGDREGLALFVVDSQSKGLRRRSYLTQDRLRAADITLSQVEVPATHIIGEPGQALPVLERVIDSAIAAVCAEAVGAMQRTLDLTVDYMKVRKQFGTTISSFQALQHRAVDMLVMVEQARSMALYATMMSEATDREERSAALSAAKVQIGRSAKFVGEQAIQLHGGIGVTEECQAGHYYRRLTMIEILFGDSAHHLSALAKKR